jgi:hypothetical protein
MRCARFAESLEIMELPYRSGCWRDVVSKSHVFWMSALTCICTSCERHNRSRAPVLPGAAERGDGGFHLRGRFEELC